MSSILVATCAIAVYSGNVCCRRYERRQCAPLARAPAARFQTRRVRELPPTITSLTGGRLSRPLPPYATYSLPPSVTSDLTPGHLLLLSCLCKPRQIKPAEPNILPNDTHSERTRGFLTLSLTFLSLLCIPEHSICIPELACNPSCIRRTSAAAPLRITVDQPPQATPQHLQPPRRVLHDPRTSMSAAQPN